jgi:hypothetical protein
MQSVILGKGTPEVDKNVLDILLTFTAFPDWNNIPVIDNEHLT